MLLQIETWPYPKKSEILHLKQFLTLKTKLRFFCL